MAVTIDATVGGASSNSYITLIEANAFNEQNIHDTTWLLLTDDQKNAVIVWATRLLDTYMLWKGKKATVTQRLQWPRKYTYYKNTISTWTEDPEYWDSAEYAIPETIIPDWLKEATAEYARLLGVSDRAADNSMAGFKEITVDVITLKADKTTIPKQLPNQILDMIWYYGRYIRSRNNQLLVRV